MHVRKKLQDAARLLEHGDTPAAYSEWREYQPMLGERDYRYLQEELTFSDFAASEPLGCARERFARMLLSPERQLLDRWMRALATTPAQDFRDFHLVWLRNLKQMGRAEHTDSFLDLYEEWKVAPKSVRSPESVIIELTRSCNYACGMCSSRTGGFRPEFTMPLKEFGEYVRVLSPEARVLRINGYGESTLIPDLGHYLDCLDQFGFKGQREIITNLSGTESCYKALVSHGFFIFASWDGHNAEIFETLRCGSKFEEVSLRLRQLANFLSAEPYRLNLIFTVQRTNLDSIIPVTQLAIDYNIGLVLFNMVNEPNGPTWMTELETRIADNFKQAANLAMGTRTTLRIPDHIGDKAFNKPFSNRTSGTRCDRPWREVMVNFDGELTCCNMFNPFSYGVLRHPNLHLDTQQRFSRLWNGPNAMFFRKSLNLTRPHPYCEGCYFLYPN
jgi:MoaA/NifB/PqqE/SkfB family radical SAM enzyme